MLGEGGDGVDVLCDGSDLGVCGTDGEDEEEERGRDVVHEDGVDDLVGPETGLEPAGNSTPERAPQGERGLACRP